MDSTRQPEDTYQWKRSRIFKLLLLLIQFSQIMCHLETTDLEWLLCMRQDRLRRTFDPPNRVPIKHGNHSTDIFQYLKPLVVPSSLGDTDYTQHVLPFSKDHSISTRQLNQSLCQKIGLPLPRQAFSRAFSQADKSRRPALRFAPVSTLNTNECKHVLTHARNMPASLSTKRIELL